MCSYSVDDRIVNARNTYGRYIARRSVNISAVSHEYLSSDEKIRYIMNQVVYLGRHTVKVCHVHRDELNYVHISVRYKYTSRYIATGSTR